MKKSVALSACAIIALAGTSASAQVINWATNTSGDWANPNNWLGNNVPDSTAEDAVLGLVGAYTVDTFANYAYGSLSITNPQATLHVGSNQTMTLNGGSLFNDGTIVVNPTGTVFNAHLSFNADTTIAGNGSIVLNAQNEPNDAQILGNTFTISNTNGHTIRGSGNISGTMANAGTITADIPGGVGLRLTGTLTQSPNGVAGADGGTLILGNGSVTTGGRFVTVNGGRVEAQNTATIGNINNTGDLDIPGQGWYLLLDNNILNNGTININSNNAVFNAHLRFDVAATIAGTGTIAMASNGDLGDAQILTNGAFNATIGTNQTVEGSGLIDGANGGTIVNNGTINGNDPAVGLGLEGNHAGNGTYRSDDGLVELRNGLILDGGTFETTGDGIIDMTTGGLVTLSNITNNGHMGIRGQGGTVALAGPITNNGTLSVNSNDAVFNAHLRFDTAATIDGNGIIEMKAANTDPNDAQILTNGAFNATIGTNQTVAGSGTINGQNDGTIVNHGMIRADDPAANLQLQGNHFGDSIGIYNATDATLALMSGLVLDYGVFNTTGTGIIETTGGGVATLSRITNNGTMGIRGQGGTIALTDYLTNNGTIKINSNSNLFNAHLRFDAATVIDGNGTIEMIISNSDFGDAQILNDQGFIGTIGQGQTITGNGRIQGEMNMNGTIDPGSTHRRFDIDTLHLAPTSAMIADLGGLLAGEFDRLLLGNDDTINLDGTLTVNLDTGYTPAFGDTWDIIDGGTINSQFATENLPNAPIGQVYRVIYESDRVFVILTCDADYTGDGVLNFFDVSKFLELFSAQDPDADINGDGSFNFFDISAFLQIFSAPCE